MSRMSVTSPQSRLSAYTALSRSLFRAFRVSSLALMAATRLAASLETWLPVLRRNFSTSSSVLLRGWGRVGRGAKGSVLGAAQCHQFPALSHAWKATFLSKPSKNKTDAHLESPKALSLSGRRGSSARPYRDAEGLAHALPPLPP